MLVQQLNVLYPLVAILLVLAVFVLYVHYTTDRHFRIKLLLGPVLLAACVFTAPIVGARLGYAWATPLPASFQYIAHRTVVIEGEKRWIDVLVVSRKPLGREARLHRVPWSKPMEQVLDEAQRMKEGPEGGDIVVNGSPRPGGARDGDAGYAATRVLPQDEVRKGPAPQPREAPPVPQEPAAPRSKPFQYLT